MTDDLPDFRERSALGPEEKETIIKVMKDGRARVFSEQRGIMRRLYHHPEGEVRRLVLDDGSKVESPECLRENETVTAVTTVLPVGCIKIKQVPRDQAGVASVVTRQVLPPRGEGQ